VLYYALLRSLGAAARRPELTHKLLRGQNARAQMPARAAANRRLGELARQLARPDSAQDPAASPAAGFLGWIKNLLGAGGAPDGAEEGSPRSAGLAAGSGAMQPADIMMGGIWFGPFTRDEPDMASSPNADATIRAPPPYILPRGVSCKLRWRTEPRAPDRQGAGARRARLRHRADVRLGALRGAHGPRAGEPGLPRARSHCRFVLPPSHFRPDPLAYSGTTNSETTMRPNPRPAPCRATRSG
jgi:hypothetical protein